MGYAEPDGPSERDLERGDLNPQLRKEIDRLGRQEAAIALKVHGYTYSQIASILDYASAARAREAVEKGLAQSIGNDDKERVRFINARRLERLLRVVMPAAEDPDNEDYLAAARTGLAIIDRHIRLYGADAPTEMVVYNPSITEIETWLAQAVQHVRTGVPDEVDIITGELVAGNESVEDEEDERDAG